MIPRTMTLTDRYVDGHQVSGMYHVRLDMQVDEADVVHAYDLTAADIMQVGKNEWRQVVRVTPGTEEPGVHMAGYEMTTGDFRHVDCHKQQEAWALPKPPFFINETSHRLGQALSRTFTDVNDTHLDWLETVGVPSGVLSCDLVGTKLPHSVQSHTAQAQRRSAMTVQRVIGVCMPEAIGDGWCDDACNQAAFQWDGGDCCAPTRPNAHNGESNDFHCLIGPTILLLHGASWPVPNTLNLDNQFSDLDPSIEDQVIKWRLWGNLPQRLRTCTPHVIFNSHDTTNVGWTNLELQRAYYFKALSVVRQGGMVLAHSMANLVLAGACLFQYLCDVRWYAMAAPFYGAVAVSLPYPIHGLAVDLNNTGVRSMRPSIESLGNGRLAAKVMEQALILDGVCGTSPYGSGGFTGVELTSMARLSHDYFGTDMQSDGVVHINECLLNSSWTRLPLNHQDLAGVSFHRHDGLFQWLLPLF